eukprot:TRINITY_DN2349_c0_g4_i2.p3 TRINITY_DN2349_c0_g4~~TRINITY_DN2349_c0_g4_i2.p3  ORF type:complete len:103 (-),score=16.48 TRINITY_DN2349_c0_g4_i2:286-594(-)
MGSGASSKKATASPRVAVAKHALPGEVGFGPKATDIDAAGVSEGKSLRGGGCRSTSRAFHRFNGCRQSFPISKVCTCLTSSSSSPFMFQVECKKGFDEGKSS